MPIYVDNLDWMFVNILLAVLPIFAGLLFLFLRQWYWKVFFGVVWLLFVPNTIYILTDIKHIPFNVSQTSTITDTLLVLIEYIVLEVVGIFSFLFAVYPIERAITRYRKKKHTIDTDLFLFFLNFLIGFGVTLGRIQRTNSWEVVTNMQKVVADISKTLTSPQMLLFVLIFGIISNSIYFLMRDTLPSLLQSFIPVRQRRR